LVVNSKMHQLYGIDLLHQLIDPLHSLKSNLLPKRFPSNFLNNPYAPNLEIASFEFLHTQAKESPITKKTEKLKAKHHMVSHQTKYQKTKQTLECLSMGVHKIHLFMNIQHFTYSSTLSSNLSQSFLWCISWPMSNIVSLRNGNIQETPQILTIDIYIMKHLVKFGFENIQDVWGLSYVMM
jgi:hypothetical protein